MSDANYIFTLVWPMFFSYCGLLGWNVVGSGTLRVSGKNSHVCSQPKRASLGPAKMPQRISRPAGPAAKGSGGRAFFLDEAKLFLHRSGDPLLIGLHRGIPRVWNYTCEAASGQKGQGIGRAVYQTQYEHHHRTSHGSPSEH